MSVKEYNFDEESLCEEEEEYIYEDENKTFFQKIEELISNPVINDFDGLIKQIFFMFIYKIFQNISEYFPSICLKLVELLIYDFPYLIKDLYEIYILKINKPEMFEKTVEINYYTETKTLNELYKAVYWYLSNSQEIDFLTETPLKFTYEKKLSSDKHIDFENETVNKFIMKDKEKTLFYKNYQIIYSLSNELISVWTDKERKKENYKIKLHVLTDYYNNEDILEDFCKHCLIEYSKNLSSSVWEQYIFTNHNSNWNFKKSNNRRKIETVILRNNLMEDIKNDVQLFLNSEEWYLNRDIPYTRGYLFYGKPGTGKTSMIKGLSLYCKRHIHYLLLNNIKSDAELLDLLSKINYKETILVIEDIDCVNDIVKERTTKNDNKIDNQEENKKEDKNKSTLSLSGILNALDGLFTTEGRILIMTTNHPEVLDKALIRKGRIDREFLFDYCDKEQIKELFQMYFNMNCPDECLEHIDENKYSPAQISSLLLTYRDNPTEAFNFIDEVELLN